MISKKENNQIHKIQGEKRKTTQPHATQARASQKEGGGTDHVTTHNLAAKKGREKKQKKEEQGEASPPRTKNQKGDAMRTKGKGKPKARSQEEGEENQLKQETQVKNLLHPTFQFEKISEFSFSIRNSVSSPFPLCKKT